MLTELEPQEVSYSFGGLKLFGARELKEEQRGYSVGTNGESLCGAQEGAWRASWIVIGYDTGLGDPIFVDAERAGLPVFTAIHGEGAWDPKPVAISLRAFAQCWREFARIAQGRSNPVEEEANPLTPNERDSFLRRIREINGPQIGVELWTDLLAYGEGDDE